MPGANPNKNPNKRTTPPKARLSEAVVTSASEWSASPSMPEGVVIELPSGRSCRAARLLNLESLLRSGRIPNPLAGVVQKMMDNRETSFAPEQMNDPEMSGQMLDMVDNAVENCMLEPKAIRPPMRGHRPLTGAKFDESDEEYNERLAHYDEILSNPAEYNTISTEWMSIEDRVFLFFFSQGGAADLATFRSTTRRAMASVSA